MPGRWQQLDVPSGKFSGDRGPSPSSGQQRRRRRSTSTRTGGAARSPVPPHNRVFGRCLLDSRAVCQRSPKQEPPAVLDSVENPLEASVVVVEAASIEIQDRSSGQKDRVVQGFRRKSSEASEWSEGSHCEGYGRRTCVCRKFQKGNAVWRSGKHKFKYFPLKSMGCVFLGYRSLFLGKVFVGYKKLFLTFSEVKGVSPIVQLFLTFWKVKSGKGGVQRSTTQKAAAKVAERSSTQNRRKAADNINRKSKIQQHKQKEQQNNREISINNRARTSRSKLHKQQRAPNSSNIGKKHHKDQLKHRTTRGTQSAVKAVQAAAKAVQTVQTAMKTAKAATEWNFGFSRLFLEIPVNFIIIGC